MELTDFVQDYWQIITAVISLIVAFITLKLQNQDQERRIKNLEDTVKDMNPIFTEIRTRLASIETTLQFLTKGMK